MADEPSSPVAAGGFFSRRADSFARNIGQSMAVGMNTKFNVDASGINSLRDAMKLLNAEVATLRSNLEAINGISGGTGGGKGGYANGGSSAAGTHNRIVQAFQNSRPLQYGLWGLGGALTGAAVMGNRMQNVIQQSIPAVGVYNQMSMMYGGGWGAYTRSMWNAGVNGDIGSVSAAMGMGGNYGWGGGNAQQTFGRSVAQLQGMSGGTLNAADAASSFVQMAQNPMANRMRMAIGGIGASGTVGGSPQSFAQLATNTLGAIPNLQASGKMGRGNISAATLQASLQQGSPLRMWLEKMGYDDSMQTQFIQYGLAQKQYSSLGKQGMYNPASKNDRALLGLSNLGFEAQSLETAQGKSVTSYLERNAGAMEKSLRVQQDIVKAASSIESGMSKLIQIMGPFASTLGALPDLIRTVAGFAVVERALFGGQRGGIMTFGARGPGGRNPVQGPDPNTGLPVGAGGGMGRLGKSLSVGAGAMGVGMSAFGAYNATDTMGRASGVFGAAASGAMAGAAFGPWGAAIGGAAGGGIALGAALLGKDAQGKERNLGLDRQAFLGNKDSWLINDKKAQGAALDILEVRRALYLKNMVDEMSALGADSMSPDAMTLTRRISAALSDPEIYKGDRFKKALDDFIKLRNMVSSGKAKQSDGSAAVWKRYDIAWVDQMRLAEDGAKWDSAKGKYVSQGSFKEIDGSHAAQYEQILKDAGAYTGDPVGDRLWKPGISREVGGLTPAMRGKLNAMFQANPRLVLVSGFRSMEQQAAEYARRHNPDGTLKKGMAPIAPPGKSKHNFGMAADLGPPSEQEWIAANAERFGLKSGRSFGEKWHVEEQGAVPSSAGRAMSGEAVTDGTTGGGSRTTSSGGGGLMTSMFGSMNEAMSAGLVIPSGGGGGSWGGGGGGNTSGSGGGSAEQVARWAYNAGFRGDALTTVVAIAMRESHGNPNAYNGNKNTGDSSYGLMQINMLGSMGPARLKQFGLTDASQLLDPMTNMRAAYILSGGGKNFGAWGAYKGMSNTYNTDVNAARTAVTNAGFTGDPYSGAGVGGGGKVTVVRMDGAQFIVQVQSASDAEARRFGQLVMDEITRRAETTMARTGA